MAGGTQGQGPTVLSQHSAAAPAAPTDRGLLERFIHWRDESAFAVLVARHGPMVLAVCRRVLGNGADADDAFQATFLILVKKAASIAEPELLSNWLFGVAARTARKARIAAGRRAHHERRAVPVVSTAPQPDADGTDLRSLLDAELEQLPHKYRAPLVLCYLEGLTNEEAARRLGWPAGSISYRLARGRELLRQRLSRRAEFSPAAFGALLGNLEPVPLPETLADQTVQTAMILARDGKLGSDAALPVRRLIEDSLRSRRRTSALSVVLAVVFLVLLAAGAAAAAATDLLPWAPAASPTNPSQSGCAESCH